MRVEFIQDQPARDEDYVARDPGYRWRLVEANGRIIATSGEAYDDLYGARRAWQNVREAFRAHEEGRRRIAEVLPA